MKRLFAARPKQKHVTRLICFGQSTLVPIPQPQPQPYAHSCLPLIPPRAQVSQVLVELAKIRVEMMLARNATPAARDNSFIANNQAKVVGEDLGGVYGGLAAVFRSRPPMGTPVLIEKIIHQ